jgi:uncharacterized protein (DUF433 family)
MGLKGKRHRTSTTRGAHVESLIGRGAYPITQASRLLRFNREVQDTVNPAGIRRWAYGYRRLDRDYTSAITVDAFSQKSGTLSFLELIEIMFIASSLASGSKWKMVHEAARVAQQLLPEERHPFAHRDWFADPHGIYLRLGTESGEKILIEMAGHAQLAMEDLLRIYLKQIRFSAVTGLADAWFPLGHETPVLLDPRMSFGLPIIESGVRTDILAGRHKAGDSVEEIAVWYEVPEHEVEAAIRFEETLPAAA